MEQGNFPCFQGGSLICLFFRHVFKPLKLNEMFLRLLQIPDFAGVFLTVL